MIEVENLTKRYGEKRAVDRQDAVVQPGIVTGPRLRRPENARDLHPGDLMQQCDWTLRVCDVTVSQTTVAITVTEFGCPLHYAADTRVQLVACRAEPRASEPSSHSPRY